MICYFRGGKEAGFVYDVNIGKGFRLAPVATGGLDCIMSSSRSLADSLRATEPGTLRRCGVD